MFVARGVHWRSKTPSLLPSSFVRAMSTPQASSEEVLVQKNDTTRILTLNRPKALNSLNLSMVRHIVPLLKTWNQNNLVDKVIVKGSGSKAFCAGGDVRAIAEAGKKGDPLSKEFFFEEYQLNHLIGTFQKPYIAILNGITMGGGVGLSVHAPIRIATENTLFAMPETGIGLFPDVGGSFFLPRLDGELGMFLALTGHRLKGKDLVFLRVATHYIHSSKLEIVENQLLKATKLNATEISELLEDYTEEFNEPFSLAKYRDIIDRCFSKGSVEEITNALKVEKDPWAADVLKTLNKMSPTSLKITFRQIRNGKVLNFLECFKMEYRLTQRVMKGKDFYEGIRAVLIDKDQNPVWNPSTLVNVSDEEIQKYFDPLNKKTDGVSDFEASSHDSYHDYPHKKTALPAELDIIKHLISPVSMEQLMDKIRRDMGYFKRGTNEKVQEFVSRSCELIPGGLLKTKL